MDLPFYLDCALVVMLGLCLGSFATAVTYRELNDLSWIMPSAKDRAKEQAVPTYRSACPSCHHTLSFLDLFPVFSWLLLRGRCRYCQEKIGVMYPLIEVLCLCACLALFFVHGLSITSLFMMVSVPFLIALCVVDFKRMILPNLLVAIVGALGAAAIGLEIFFGDLSVMDGLLRLLSAVLFAGFALLMGVSVSFVLKKDALGMGDVKFFAVAGLWLGGAALPAFCILSGLSGIVLGGVWQRITGSQLFPFGPALILSLYILWLFDGSFLTVFM